MITSGTCASCGVDDELLTPVHRRYPAAPDGGSDERVLDEIELWCVPCRTTYPHVPAE